MGSWEGRNVASALLAAPTWKIAAQSCGLPQDSLQGIFSSRMHSTLLEMSLESRFTQYLHAVRCSQSRMKPHKPCPEAGTSIPKTPSRLLKTYQTSRRNCPPKAPLLTQVHTSPETQPSHRPWTDPARWFWKTTTPRRNRTLRG